MDCKCGWYISNEHQEFGVKNCKYDKLHDIPASITKLFITECNNFVELVENTISIDTVSVWNCENLQRAKILNTREIHFSECPNLTDICADQFTEFVTVYTCRNMTKLNFSTENNIQTLKILKCENLREITGLKKLLSKIYIERCPSLIRIEAENDSLTHWDYHDNFYVCNKLVLIPLRWLDEHLIGYYYCYWLESYHRQVAYRLKKLMVKKIQRKRKVVFETLFKQTPLCRDACNLITDFCYSK